MYERKDYFYKKAKKEGLASRAAYKIEEIQKGFKITKPGNTVLDLGCAPGGWLQFLSKITGLNGFVIGIDRAPLKIPLPKNATFIQKKIEEVAENELPKVDCIVSDLSPDLTGIPFKDIYQSFELAQMVWRVSRALLKPGGNLVLKIFPGEETNQFKMELKKYFKSLKTFIPQATRKTSSEVYIIAKGYSPQK